MKPARPLTVEANLGLVHAVVKHYRWAARGALEVDDLLQAGALGLMRALGDYDPSRGKLSTYALPWIRHFIQRAIANEGAIVRIPVYQWQKGERPTLPVRLDTPSRDDAQLAPIDTLASDHETPLEHLEACERSSRALAALGCLDDRERIVVAACVQGDDSLASVARRLPNRRGGCVSRERARQIQESALGKLRAQTEIRQLE